MIEINGPLLITQILTFLAAMFIVWKFFWGPLTKFMQDRSQKIAGDLERAESGRREIEALEAEYHRRLAEIEDKARQEINTALQRGHKEKEEILKEARAEAQKIMDKAGRDLQAERESVLRELRRQVTDISLTAMERVIGQGLDAKVQQRLVDDVIRDLGKAEKAQ